MKLVTLDDYARRARKRVPKFLYDFIEGGVEDETAAQANVAALRRRRLLPKACVDVTHRTQATTLFGKTYSSPFGVGPAGTGELQRRGGDLMIARAAAAAGLPYCMSGASHASMEMIADAIGDHFWFQLYPAKDRRISDDFIQRAAAASVSTLIVTIDTPVNPRRQRALRNGIGIPLKFTPKVALTLLTEGLTHPGWAWDYVSHGGMPTMSNWRPYAPAGASPGEVAAYYRGQSPCVVTWEDLAHFRDLWKGKLLVKGVLRPEDAVKARELGADGVVVSNHGGKVMDLFAASGDMTPLIRSAVGDTFVIILDGGVRSGCDIVAARCLGADFVFLGRPPLYAVAAGGEPAVAGMLALLREELDLALALVGCPDVNALDASFFAPLES